MKKQPDIYVPLLCNECGQALLAQIKRQTNLYQIMRFCPENDVLIYVSLGQHEGKRAVLRWTLQGPMSEAEAMTLIAEQRKRDDADLEILHDSERLH